MVGRRFRSPAAAPRLKDTALAGGSLFAALMTAVHYLSLGQVTRALLRPTTMSVSAAYSHHIGLRLEWVDRLARCCVARPVLAL